MVNDVDNRLFSGLDVTLDDLGYIQEAAGGDEGDVVAKVRGSLLVDLGADNSDGLISQEGLELLTIGEVGQRLGGGEDVVLEHRAQSLGIGQHLSLRQVQQGGQLLKGLIGGRKKRDTSGDGQTSGIDGFGEDGQLVVSQGRHQAARRCGGRREGTSGESAAN